MTFKKIEFKNKQEPAVSAQNLNLLQDNIEDIIGELAIKAIEEKSFIKETIKDKAIKKIKEYKRKLK